MEQPFLDFSKLIKAQAVFERFRHNMKDDQDQAGAVQAFEFCYELAWKMMKRYLANQGVEAVSPRDTFRKAAIAHIIDDPEVWFDFQDKRNLTAHTYEQENLDVIIEIFDLFSEELNTIVSRMQE